MMGYGFGMGAGGWIAMAVFWIGVIGLVDATMPWVVATLASRRARPRSGSWIAASLPVRSTSRHTSRPARSCARAGA